MLQPSDYSWSPSIFPSRAVVWVPLQSTHCTTCASFRPSNTSIWLLVQPNHSSGCVTILARALIVRSQIQPTYPGRNTSLIASNPDLWLGLLSIVGTRGASFRADLLGIDRQLLQKEVCKGKKEETSQQIERWSVFVWHRKVRIRIQKEKECRESLCT
jgi:hypothetical protein